MRRARFQVFRVGADDVGWRFVAPNNWELARSAGRYEDVGQTRAAILDVVEAGETLAFAVVMDSRSRWRWEASLDGAPVVVSSRAYYRRVECEGTLHQFRSLAPAADIAPSVAMFRVVGTYRPDLGVAHPGRALAALPRRPLIERRGPVGAT